VHDAIQLTERGVPAVAVVTEPFVPTAEAVADAYGHPPALAVVEHPISHNGAARLRAKAEAAVRQAVLVWSGGRPPATSARRGGPDAEAAGEWAEDAWEAIETAFAWGWTDGLPVVPPTPERLRPFLDAAGLAPDAVVAEEPVRRRRLTVAKIAVNALMAGCRPEYMPVVLAAVQAMADPAFNLHGSAASTGGSAVLVVVNGPVRRQLGFNATHNAMANGFRANATVGRAVRLIITNLLGGVPGVWDRSTLGHPGKFTFCLAEDEEDSSWLPLAAERGVPPGRSAVTVVAVESPHQLMNEWTTDPAEILDTFVAAIRANMLTYSVWPGPYVLVVPKQLRDVLQAAGWQKADIRRYVYERAVVRREEWRGVGKGRLVSDANRDRIYRALKAPEDLLVVAAGGPAGGFGAVIPPWFGDKSQAVTRIVEGV
jgi:hypothetical protein